MSKFRCSKVHATAGAFMAPDGQAMPCRAWQVQFFNIEHQRGPQWGVVDIAITVLHECHFVVGQVYELDFER